MQETKNFDDLDAAELDQITLDRAVKLLGAVINGPIGQAMLDLAEGRSEIVIKQAADGFVVRVVGREERASSLLGGMVDWRQAYGQPHAAASPHSAASSSGGEQQQPSLQRRMIDTDGLWK